MMRVDPGRYKVKVTSGEGAGDAEAVVPVDAAQTAPPVEVALAAGSKVKGRIVKLDGSAVVGAPVLPAPNLGEGKLMIRMEGEPLTTGADGSFTLDVPAGRHLLVVLGDGSGPGAPSVRHPFSVSPGQTVDLGVLKAGGAPPPPPPGGQPD